MIRKKSVLHHEKEEIRINKLKISRITEVGYTEAVYPAKKYNIT